jgi:hypothetical protein
MVLCLAGHHPVLSIGGNARRRPENNLYAPVPALSRSHPSVAVWLLLIIAHEPGIFYPKSRKFIACRAKDELNKNIRVGKWVVWPRGDGEGSEVIRESMLADLWTSAQRGRPFGSEDWMMRIARQLGLESTMNPRGRPKLS